MTNLNSRLDQVGLDVADHLDEIKALFKPGTKVTLLLRQPSHPDGSRDFLMSDDDPDKAVEAIRLRQTAPTITREV